MYEKFDKYKIRYSILIQPKFLDTTVKDTILYKLLIIYKLIEHLPHTLEFADT